VHRFLKGGNPEKAKELLGKALELSQHLSDVTVLFQLLYLLAKVFHNEREISEAANCYDKAEAIIKRIGSLLPEELQARYFEDSRRKVFAEDIVRFRKESQVRAATLEVRERPPAAADLRERPASLENYKEVLDRILRVNSAMSQLHFPERILVEGLELVRAERGFVMFVRNRDYRVTAAKGFGTEVEQHPEFTAASQMAEEAVRRGKTILPQSGEERRQSKHAPFEVFSSRSVVAVPLMTDDRIFGALFLDRHLSLGRFSPREQSLLETFARHVGVFLQNRRNFDAAIREPLTGFLTPSYFIERLREEYRLFNLHSRPFSVAGFYLPALEDAVGEARGDLGEKLAAEIEEVRRGVAVCWGNPVLFVLYRNTELTVAEELSERVRERLEVLLSGEVPYQVLAADRRHQQGSDIYNEIRRKLLPEEGDHRVLAELRRLLARDIKLKDAKKIIEKHIIEATLRKTGGNITHAARELGIHRPQLSNYLKKYGLKRERYERELGGFEDSAINPLDN
jgi:GAF domain-containing protein